MGVGTWISLGQENKQWAASAHSHEAWITHCLRHPDISPGNAGLP